MKMYTNSEQTAKLIELGFEKPKMAAPALKWVDGEPTFEPQYTIGELIEMLPPKVGEWNLSIERYWEFELWVVSYEPCDCFSRATELRDALYNMIVKLKVDGVI